MHKQPPTSLTAQRPHLRIAAAPPPFTVLNYGFSSDPEDTVIPTDEPEFYCLRLYEHALRATPLENANVLELACGRGGGSNFLSRVYRPNHLIGVDASGDNVRLARDWADNDDIEFVQGNTERLDFADESFDVVIHVAPAELDGDRARMLAQAFRVLRPGGHFCYTDGCWADCDRSGDFAAAGFELLERHEITANVVRALRRDSARREALFDAVPNRVLRDKFKDASGVVGYDAFRRFECGQARYFSHCLARPAERPRRRAPGPLS